MTIEALQTRLAWASPARALYVHVPFCLAKCHYCDFNSRGPSPGSLHGRQHLASYAEAVVWEVEEYARVGAGGGNRLRTMYVGGGTPTVLDESDLAGILGAARSAFGLAPGYELTVEANPGTLGPRKLEGLLAAGANRLSIGIQSLADDELALLGRVHSAEEARGAVSAARASGFANISVDLMFGLPGQTLQGWLDTLVAAIDLGPDHVSAYCLTLEEGTRLASDVKSGRLPAPDDDLCADMLAATAQTLLHSGYEHYEISNFARRGFQSRHNMTYWHYEPYIGAGAGAVGFTGRARYSNALGDSEYMALCAAGQLPLEGIEPLGPSELMSEACFMGLRVLAGLDTEAWRKRFGRALDDVFPGVVAGLVQRGLLEREGAVVRLTGSGVALGNLVFQEFLP